MQRLSILIVIYQNYITNGALSVSYTHLRGHHYAYHACLLLQKQLQFHQVILTCDPHNQASLRTDVYKRQMLDNDDILISSRHYKPEFDRLEHDLKHGEIEI